MTRTMMTAAGLLAALFLGLPATANAQGGVAPQIVVPENPGGGGPNAGCYRIAGDLYGPYRMSFCLGSSGGQKTYRVTGGGLDCRGRLDWYSSGAGQVQVNLRRSSCGRGQAWSPDTMTCNFTPSGPWPFQNRGGYGVAPQIVVPDRPDFGRSLTCYYVPSEPGYPPSWVRATRVG